MPIYTYTCKCVKQLDLNTVVSYPTHFEWLWTRVINDLFIVAGNINHGYNTVADKGPYEHPEVQRTILEIESKDGINGANNTKF